MDQAQPVEIEWRLVGHPGRLRRDPAQQREIISRQIVRRFEGSKKSPPRCPARWASGPEWQLAAGSDRRMAGKNLLDQGRAGTRHADDQ